MKPYILAETNWKTLRDQEIDLVILPWGATEAHNLHLPFSTDNIMADRVAAEAARLAWERGARPLVLPAIPFGVNTGQMDIRLNINMNPGTQYAILTDIADVLTRHGISKFLILNGHGGNDFRQMIRELGLKFPGLFICTCNWYKSFGNEEFFEKGGGHADEMETSMMQYIAPELVLPLSEAGSGHGKKFRIRAFNEGWAWAERKWTQVTSDTGIGDPSRATSEKGAACFAAVAERIGEFIWQLCTADKDNMYE